MNNKKKSGFDVADIIDSLGKEVQNFMTVIVYENYEERFKRKISEISVEDNNKNEKGFGIFNLVAALGTKFLDKLEAIVDY
ncbi:hypothetical protein RhiirA4_471551 [Rhizophagus irregularis]|uniref:Uncharacterized protein n=1 Tax=Rhizophagus irregularis TaxID=588596 RepID=A0A2I1H3I2_9GLOM|nr:hypothetical protein RhiirA4_471551 [Rhizophagus irregularis]